MQNKCPFFGKCGGCIYDFNAPDYRAQKLQHVEKLKPTNEPVWIDAGNRRRADFCFAPNQFGLFEAKSKNIINITHCPNLRPEINAILPQLASMPWMAAGACLVTMCDNGIDVAITSNVPYFTPEFKQAAEKLNAIRITWNDKIIKQTQTPMVSFGGHAVEYPSGAFLQPTIVGADTMRDLVVEYVGNAKRVIDLFCGIGNFTFATNADGFDIVGIGQKRDLFKKPVTAAMLNQYDVVILDPPRAGADAQCHEIVRSNIQRVIYVSCNPNTFERDAKTLKRGGYKLSAITPVDQFVGSNHWEIVAVFDK